MAEQRKLTLLLIVEVDCSTEFNMSKILCKSLNISTTKTGKRCETREGSKRELLAQKWHRDKKSFTFSKIHPSEWILVPLHWIRIKDYFSPFFIANGFSFPFQPHTFIPNSSNDETTETKQKK